jgi:hypothetical protein
MGKNHRKDVIRLTPQVALLQPVSVEWINKCKAQLLAPELWTSTNAAGDDMPQYQLSPYEEASPDGMETRFIRLPRAIITRSLLADQHGPMSSNLDHTTAPSNSSRSSSNDELTLCL